MSHQKDNLREQIDRYVAGELNPDEIEQLWQDLLDHPDLLEELKAQATLKTIYQPRQEHKATAEIHNLNRNASDNRKYITWAASVAAVLLIAIFIGFLWDGAEDERPMAITSISLNHMESPDVLRSTDEELSVADSLMHAGYSAAVNNQTNVAIAYFEEAGELELDAAPADEVKLNLGIIYYNDRNFEQAAKMLSAAIDETEDRDTRQKASWFLANTYAQLGDYENAYRYANQVHEAGRDYADEAFRLLRNLENRSEVSLN